MSLLYESYSFKRAKGRFQKTPTKLLTTLGRTVGTAWESIQGKEVPSGTVAEIRGTLYDQAYNFLASKPIKVYHKLGTGAYGLVTTLYTNSNGSFVLYYPLPEGIHAFYCEFEGDSQYEGCAG